MLGCCIPQWPTREQLKIYLAKPCFSILLIVIQSYGYPGFKIGVKVKLNPPHKVQKMNIYIIQLPLNNFDKRGLANRHIMSALDGGFGVHISIYSRKAAGINVGHYGRTPCFPWACFARHNPVKQAVLSFMLIFLPFSSQAFPSRALRDNATKISAPKLGTWQQPAWQSKMLCTVMANMWPPLSKNSARISRICMRMHIQNLFHVHASVIAITGFLHERKRCKKNICAAVAAVGMGGGFKLTSVSTSLASCSPGDNGALQILHSGIRAPPSAGVCGSLADDFASAKRAAWLSLHYDKSSKNSQ